MSSTTPNRFYKFGDFTVDVNQKVLLRNGTLLAVTPKLFDTLLILLENGGRIVAKEELISQLWPDTFVEESNLTFNVQRLRKVLGDNARQPVFIETVARRGYRFIGKIEKLLSDTDEADTNTGLRLPDSVSNVERTVPTSNTVGKAVTLGRTKVFLGAAVVAMVLIGAGFYWTHRPVRPQPVGGKVMMAVLPFKNLTGDDFQEYFSDGLTEEVITQMGNRDPNHLGVIASTSVMHYKNSEASVDKVSHELGVQYLLEGSVRRDANKVRIAAQLIETKNQTQIWAREYDRELGHLLSLQEEIAQEVGDEIEVTLGEHKRIQPTAQSSSPQFYEAYDLYLKGQYFFNKRTSQAFEQAINYFQQAINKDPNYAQAYAGLADSYALIGGYSGRLQTDLMPKARAAALRAVELDESLAEAHTALALVVQNYDWDWQTAEKEFRQSIALNPNYATAHHWYAEHLTWLGRFDEALRESESARKLDPLSLIIASDNAAILYYARQYDRAIAQCRSVREMEPNFGRAGIIELAYEQKGLFPEALSDVEKAQRTSNESPWTLSELAYIYGRTGQQGQAQRELEKLLELDHRQKLDPATIFWAYLGMGNRQQAFAYLEKAYAEHSNVLMTLKVEPRFDPIRGDPRFQDLLHRIRLAT